MLWTSYYTFREALTGMIESFEKARVVIERIRKCVATFLVEGISHINASDNEEDSEALL